MSIFTSCSTGLASGPKRSGCASYCSMYASASGASERSTDEPSSSSTSRRDVRTRSESVCTTIPASAFREHAGTSVRAPSSSTTHTRHTFTGVSVSP